MGAVSFVARSQLRRRLSAAVVLALVVGVLGGLTLSLFAGWRRSSTVVDRFEAAASGYTLLITDGGLDRSIIESFPGVERLDFDAYVAMVTPDAVPGQPDAGINGAALDYPIDDPTIRLLDGEFPDTSDPSAVLINKFLADASGLEPGDDINVRMFALDQMEQVAVGDYHAEGPEYTFRVAGVVRLPQDIVSDKIEATALTAYGSNAGMIVSSAWHAEHADEFLGFESAYNVQLAPNASIDDFVAAMHDAGADESFLYEPYAAQHRISSFQTPVSVENTTLLLLAVGAALALIVVAALLLRFEQRAHEADAPAVQILGGTRRQIAAIAALRTLPVAIGGALLSVVLAIALSGRFPIGIGRLLELDGGIKVDGPVLVTGAALVTMLVLALAAWSGRVAPPRAHQPSGRATITARLARTGAPVNAVLGSQLAFGRGRRARLTPSRLAIVGGAAALAIVGSVSIVVTGIDRTYTTKADHGWDWDVVIGNVNFPYSEGRTEEIAADPRIEAATSARYSQLVLDGHPVEAIAFDPEGTAPPRPRSGRLPTRPDEIALGGPLLDDLGVDVGDTVTLSVADTEFAGDGPASDVAVTVVGTVLIPTFGESDMGEVAAVPFETIREAGGDTTPNLVFADVDGGSRAMIEAIDADFTEEMFTDYVQARIVNLHRVRSLPLGALAVAAVLGTVVLAYGLVAGSRAHRHDLATMQALGLSLGRVSRVLAWQGSIVGTTMLAFGLPVGVYLGAIVWRAIADDLGVRTTIDIPPLLWLLVPATIVVALLASLIPARLARRHAVADLLRVE